MDAGPANLKRWELLEDVRERKQSLDKSTWGERHGAKPAVGDKAPDERFSLGQQLVAGFLRRSKATIGIAFAIVTGALSKFFACGVLQSTGNRIVMKQGYSSSIFIAF